MKTAREHVDEIWGTETLSDISEFNIPLSMAVSMMENFSKEQNSELLERYNEAIEVLKGVERLKDLLQYPEDTKEEHREEARAVSLILSEVEQTISKAKP